MYQLAPISDRIKALREKYRSTKPKIDLARYRLITDYYMNHQYVVGILKRANNLRNLFEKMPTPVRDDELIVGFVGEPYRCTAVYPENSHDWFMRELDNCPTRDIDPYDIDEEDKQYLIETQDFWLQNAMNAVIDEYYPEEYRDLVGNAVLNFTLQRRTINPIGHFCGNLWTVVDEGLAGVAKQAHEKRLELLNKGINGDDAKKYEFYRAVETVTEGIIIYTKRYAAECLRQAETCTDEKRRAELLKMGDSLNWIMENPCRTYHEALQAIMIYQTGLILDAQLHGLSFGRMDQYVGKYLEADLAAGRLTVEEAQELTDFFMLKVAEYNRNWMEVALKSAPGYTSGQLVTLGGVDRDGNDASNMATYMFLQSSSRLKLHSPPVALRVHDNTPDSLWEAAIECTKRVGGVPTFEYDGVIIPAQMKRGIPLEDARNYTLIGCVEPAICGCDFANSGGDGCNSYTILPQALLLAINNGRNPYHAPGTPALTEGKAVAPETGYLYEMNSMEDVLKAYATQIEFFTRWQANMIHCYEYVYSFTTPLPLLSATVTGCMESGKDVMWGGSKYTNTGNSSLGHGTVADSLNIIDQVCFRDKKATTRELYDAIMNNWEGYEDLHQYVLYRCSHFGNNDPEADKYLKFVADTYSDGITRHLGPRGNHWTAGCWPVTMHVVHGNWCQATPDGRCTGEPLSDGVSPCQGMDQNGPFSTINSILKFDQTKYANGTLCNMKFHPTALQGEQGIQKLKNVMQTYFEGGGMHLQLNIVSADTLRAAQKNPDEYKDLVVRIAGFSSYFVEVYKKAQDDLIKRTEMSM